MEEHNHEFNVEKYKTELASLRRVATQLNDLRKWFLNVSLACLAFAFAIMLKAKVGDSIPHETLAAFTLGFLILSVVGGILIRGKHELDNFLADSKNFFSLLPVFRDMLIKSPEVSEIEKLEITGWLDRAIAHVENQKVGKDNQGPSIYTDIYIIVAEFIVLLTGLGCLCLYLWHLLFNV